MQQTGIKPLQLKNVTISGPFWGKYMELVRTQVIPYQWEVMNDRTEDAPKSHCIKNFEIAAGRAEGEFYGMVFQDSDVYKWLESVAYSLATHPDATLEKLADDAIDLIAAAQDTNGYVNTYFTIKEPTKRWVNLVHGHELYCAGHLIEAAVAYFDATGKRAFLEIAIKFANNIDSVFGPEEGKCKGYPGHQEVELALYKLYAVTGEARYLQLAAYFIKQRGQQPHYFEKERENPEFFEIFPDLRAPDWSYSQSHIPPVEQRVAAGHSVRAVYMYAAMADLAAATGDEALKTACDALYDNVVNKQMYVTGAIGSSAWGEKFTVDYDLPNDLIYGETCASVGLMMFARRMNVLHGDAAYADTMELALYNTVLAGMSLTGKNFFYVNPLEVDPLRNNNHPTLRHVRPVRPKWFACACCPANLARTVTGLGLYAYAASPAGLYVNLYAEGEAADGGRKVVVKTAYPFGDKAVITVSGGAFKLFLRDPQHAKITAVSHPQAKLEKGYYVLEGDWQGQEIELTFDMAPKRVYADGVVQNNAGKAAVMAGPIVYCAESVDNGPMLGSLLLDDTQAPQKTAMPEGLPTQAAAYTAAGYRLSHPAGGLYRQEKPARVPHTLTLIPYFLWANRGENEMRVFLPVI